MLSILSTKKPPELQTLIHELHALHLRDIARYWLGSHCDRTKTGAICAPPSSQLMFTCQYRSPVNTTNRYNEAVLLRNERTGGDRQAAHEAGRKTVRRRSIFRRGVGHEVQGHVAFGTGGHHYEPLVVDYGTMRLGGAPRPLQCSIVSLPYPSASL